MYKNKVKTHRNTNVLTRKQYTSGSRESLGSLEDSGIHFSDTAGIKRQKPILTKQKEFPTIISFLGGASNQWGQITGTLADQKDLVTVLASAFTPVISKGPAIISTGFAGTLTATNSTTVTFSSAADAILAGQSATNPIVGTTLISNALTRYIVSWTNATTCVVDSAVTWAGTAITSVQYPIILFCDSSGVVKGGI